MLLKTAAPGALSLALCGTSTSTSRSEVQTGRAGFGKIDCMLRVSKYVCQSTSNSDQLATPVGPEQDADRAHHRENARFGRLELAWSMCPGARCAQCAHLNWQLLATV